MIKRAAVFGAALLCSTMTYAQQPTATSDVSQEPSKRDKIPVDSVPADTKTDEDLVVLSPFEVSTQKDTGYQASQTLAGTRIRTDLKDVGSAISVYTKDFMRDIGATDSATLLQYTTNAEVAGTRGTYAGLGNGTSVDETANLRSPAGAQRVRGLASADLTRDFFVTDIPWDSFNTDRIDIQRGPNSLLFGLGSPAGIVNGSLHNAEFNNKGSAEVRVGSYGSVRKSIDINHQLIPGVLTVRVDGLLNNEKYEQRQAYSNDKRLYGTVRFDPQLFDNKDFHTSIKVKYEHGDIDADRPRITPPNDSLTPWFRDVDNTSMWGGLGRQGVSNGYAVGSVTTNTSNWLGTVGDQQQPIWFIDGTTNQLYRAYGGYINPGALNSDGTALGVAQGLLGKNYSPTFLGILNLPQYANNAHLTNAQYGQYRNMSLNDKSIFDFYHNLIDGPTKSEYENWSAYNVDFSQTAFNDRLGVDLSLDAQHYTRGGQALLGGSPTLMIDVLKNFQDYYLTGANGTTSVTNPNYGRPFVVGGPGSGSSYTSDRKYARAALFGELRTSDFTDNSFLVKLLGKHRFNAIYSDERYATENRSWQMYANSREWDGYWNANDGSSNAFTNRPPVGVIYLGPSIANRTSATGAQIPGITAGVTLQDANIYAFDSTWKNYSVSPTAAWTVPSSLSAVYNSSTATTQASNPANYVGWNTNFRDSLLRYNNGQDDSLLTKAQKSLRDTISYAGSWQGYMWNDAFIPTVGWRYDQVTGKGVTAQANSLNRSILNLSTTGSLPYALPNGAVDPNNADTKNMTYSVYKGHSLSSGMVVHLNKILNHDPLPINVSLSYNKSDNFQISDTRRDIYGNVISNPNGNTKDFGLLLATKDQKYTLRVVKYTTDVKNASTQLDSSGLGNVVQQGLRWRNVFLYKLSNYPWSSREQSQDRNTWATAYIDATTGRPVAAGSVASGPTNSVLQTQAQADAMRDASITAWNNIQKFLESKGYFTAWNYTPTTSSALTDRTTYQAAMINATDPAPQYAPDPATVYAYSYTTPQGFAVTADTESKGYEFEFTANPLPNWRVSFNASETTAVRTNVGGAQLDQFVTFMDQQMAGAAGDMRQYSGGYVASNEVRYNWNSWRGNYTLLKLQEGAAASELRKWRYNIVSNYSFTHGFLKGVGVGASYRWQDKVVIGYPVVPQTATIATFDLSKPYYGPSEDAGDVWLSYERRLSKDINWKIQLNIRNLLKKDGLIPTSVEADGQTWAAARVKPIQEWFLTNTFMF